MNNITSIEEKKNQIYEKMLNEWLRVYELGGEKALSMKVKEHNEFIGELLDQTYSQGVTDTIKRVEEEVIGEEITIDDVANLDLPKIYTNEAEARKDLWEEAKKLNSLREHLLTKLSSMKEKGMK